MINAPGLMLLLAISLMSLWYQQEVVSGHQELLSSEAETTASAFELYHQQLTLYAERNPGVTGSPSDSAVGLPDWYTKPAAVKGYVTAGGAYTSCVGCPAEVLSRLIEISEGSMRIGVAEGAGASSKLRSPLHNNLMTLPAGAGIPAGAIVHASK